MTVTVVCQIRREKQGLPERLGQRGNGQVQAHGRYIPAVVSQVPSALLWSSEDVFVAAVKPGFH